MRNDVISQIAMNANELNATDMLRYCFGHYHFAIKIVKFSFLFEMIESFRGYHDRSS
jgi:hypothetical protein